MNPLLNVRNVSKSFRTGGALFGRGAAAIAVNDVSFTVAPGATLGIVGESGSGKTTLARILSRLVEPDSGAIFLDGTDILQLRGGEARRVTRRMQIVFQDPGSSLNPRWKVDRIVAEGIRIHWPRSPDTDERVVRLLGLCGLSEDSVRRFPHEFSGGQRQRVAIARALAVEPEILILDEPVSALDVSIQAQILDLLKELQSELGLTYVLISHDLAVVEAFCDDLMVMNQGSIVESGIPKDVYMSPKDPYTRALIEAHPDPNPRNRGLTSRS